MIGSTFVPARRVAFLLLSAASARVIWTAVHFFQDGRQGRHRVEAAWIVLVGVALVIVALPRARPAEPPSAPRLDRGTRAVSLAAAIIGSACLYWPALDVGLLSDDFTLLERSWSDTVSLHGWEHYRPLPLLVWKILFPAGGPAALHVLNVTLHGLNAWLVGRIVHGLGHSTGVAAVAGAIFLTFPAGVEPVTWASGVFDVGMVALGLTFVHTCVERKPVWVSLIPLMAALLTKETAVMLPLIATLLWFRVPVAPRTLVVSAVVTLAYSALRISAGASVALPRSEELRYAIKEAVARPFASLGVPWTGQELNLHPVLFGVVPTIVVVALLFLYCLRRAARIQAALGPVLVLVGMLPLWTFFFVADDLEGSRYLYLPLVGWCVFLADLMAHRDRPRVRMAALSMATVCLVFGIWGVRAHLRPWQDAARLRDAVLRSAAAVLADERCATPEFRNVPDVVDGAFVFRNGLADALHLPRGSDTTTGPACTLLWTDAGFVKGE